MCSTCVVASLEVALAASSKTIISNIENKHDNGKRITLLSTPVYWAFCKRPNLTSAKTRGHSKRKSIEQHEQTRPDAKHLRENPEKHLNVATCLGKAVCHFLAVGISDLTLPIGASTRLPGPGSESIYNFNIPHHATSYIILYLRKMDTHGID